MRFEEKQRARELRGQGWSYSDILKEVGVSQSTLSLWLRDIPLTDEQIAALACKFRAGREKFIHKMRFPMIRAGRRIIGKRKQSMGRSRKTHSSCSDLPFTSAKAASQSKMTYASRTATRVLSKRV